jgi:N-acetylglucosamine-6-phosphate deacetylase
MQAAMPVGHSGVSKKGWMEGPYLNINKCVLHAKNYVTVTTKCNFNLKERGGGIMNNMTNVK